jgi:hypothetical protein
VIWSTGVWKTSARPSRPLCQLRAPGQLVLTGNHEYFNDPVQWITKVRELGPRSYTATPTAARCGRAATRRAGHSTVAGLDRYGDTQLYVSRGVGAWKPPVRVGAPSDITVVERAATQA